ncbi:hypothetical protein DFH08DRAFT_1088372 [Mycena albidolilacea]|uniref:F-box domain-containing protein n=1 Tax=Mycena albidolilacea TaxID=1033008 RepID=A0AAD7EB06_9AGAR|nr:hypothetical protein DFH08DRAFT_1088372 [Mycena albidolilacea]
MENFEADADSESADYFSSLPADVILIILGFLSPHNVLSLRTVSQLMSDATRERSVWIGLLRDLCIQHDIYTPSFSLPEMSLEELEHAATAPRRFSSHLRSEFAQGGLVGPSSVRCLDPLPTGEEFEHMRLLPGGRFLLTSHKTRINLWDLGNHVSGPTHHAIASFEIPGAAAIKSLRTRASRSSSEALVIISTTDAESNFCVHIFCVFPPASIPQFTPLAPVLVLPLFNDDFPGVLGTTSRHVVIATAFTTVLWDFIDDAWVSWPRNPTEVDDTLYLCNDNFVTVHADEAEVSISQLPALFPRSVSAVPPVIDSLDILHRYPLCRFKRPEDPFEWCISGITLVFHGRERSTVDQPLYIDILTKGCNKALISHFALLPSTSTCTATATSELVPLGESPLDAMYHACHSLHLEWLAPGTVQSFVVEGSTLHVCISDVDGTTSKSVAGVLATPGMRPNDMNVDFCSFSGRVCARVPAAEGDGFKVLVMDYVAPKQSTLP